MTRLRYSAAAWWILAALLAVAHLIVIWRSLFVARYWEDEAYNLTVPLNLLRGLGYSSDAILNPNPTQGIAPTPFDVRISTGPTVLLPVALVLKLASMCGVEMWGAEAAVVSRIVPALFWVLLIVGLFVLGKRVSGRWGALLAAMMPLAFNVAASNSPIQGPADLLGEIPAAAMLVWALLVLPRRPWLAGLFLGLAIQAKYIALLAAPALLVALIVLYARPILRLWRPLLAAIGCTAIPTILMEGYAFIVLGPPGFAEHLEQTAEFLRTAGQEARTSIPDKLSTFASSWFLPMPLIWATLALAAILLIAATLIAAFHPLLLERARSSLATSSRQLGNVALAGRNELLALLLAAIIGACTFLAWWATARQTPLWVRHPAPGIFAFVPICAAYLPLALTVVAKRHRKRNAESAPAAPGASQWTLGAAAAVTLCFALVAASGAALHVRAAFAPKWQDLGVQDAAVTVLRGELNARDIEASDWVAASVWGTPVSIAVLTGSHTGLVDQPNMTSKFLVAEAPCPAPPALAEAEGYALCPPAKR